MDFVHLTGAEDVASAGRNIRDAAATMQSASSSVVEALYQQRLFLDGWLCRVEELLTKQIKEEKEND